MPTLASGKTYSFAEGFTRLRLRWGRVEGTGRCIVRQANHGQIVNVPGEVRLNERLGGSVINNATVPVKVRIDRPAA